ncbi:MAG: segregation/condensation protein A [Clostridiales bacterium]|nr:segregation/condensation protein A [Clostridiales bacterium]
MQKLQFKLEVFEGPMDLLLHLISKHKLSISDVPILLLVEQYLEYVEQMQSENLEIASEFLEMAARLVYIKTVFLLPTHEEAEKLAEELKGELTEYWDCQIVAGKLQNLSSGFNLFARLPEEFEIDPTYTRLHEPLELLRAYDDAIGKGKRKLPPPIEAFSGIVSGKIVSVSSRISFIFRSFFGRSKKKFLSFFETAESKSEMVATFLAFLTLAKAKRVAFDGEGEEVEVLLLKKGKGANEE